MTEEIRPVAVEAVRGGGPKLHVAKDARVTRRTLDAWIEASKTEGDGDE